MLTTFSALAPVIEAYGFTADGISIESFGTGLINRTWKVVSAGKEYILQKINQRVFTQPHNIAHNHQLIAAYLKEHAPGYLFVAPLPTLNGEALVYHEGEGYYRLFPFVGGSHSKEVVTTPGEAFEAARQFGQFTRLLSGFDVTSLKTTIPSFHDLSLRYRQFLDALANGNKTRMAEAKEEVDGLLAQKGIVEQYERLIHNPDFKRRVTHHDTKISNVLFNSQNKGLCVIDLDTVMPGYFISDVGDMMRTYLSPVNEEEKEFSRIEVRDDFYKALVEGYYSEMQSELTATEKRHFFFAGQFMIYMQALRFLTDHLNDDAYYGARYEGHNLVRAKNQLVLLQRLLEKKEILQQVISF
ncbi:phosphotransferase enzyme family protein [Flavisolibacter nicotianae]|uniref:phosphotransferase enzyme family protein n=1 Tax=Flavisolibacter nicotianae TaxID=2364882 RepID=UPI001F095370|nr:aminoglycoside phosphotransferase family protein [Flavisolibacter nicotianae]